MKFKDVKDMYFFDVDREFEEKRKVKIVYRDKKALDKKILKMKIAGKD